MGELPAPHVHASAMTKKAIVLTNSATKMELSNNDQPFTLLLSQPPSASASSKISAARPSSWQATKSLVSNRWRDPKSFRICYRRSGQMTASRASWLVSSSLPMLSRPTSLFQNLTIAEQDVVHFSVYRHITTFRACRSSRSSATLS